MTGPRVPLTVPDSGDASPDENPYDRLLDERRQRLRAELGRSFLAASKTTPDRHARVLTLAERTRLPADVVARNLDAVEQRQAVAATPYDRLIERNPALAEWIKHPDNASVAHDDVSTLASLEGQWRTIVHGWEAGKATNELADIGTRWAFGTPKPDDDARAKELRKQMQMAESSWGDEGVLTAAARFLGGIPGQGAQQVPITGRTLAAGAGGAAAAVAGGKALDVIGTGAAAVVGGVLGGPGGAAAATEAAGAVSGLKTAALAKGGWQVGVGVAAAQLEFGSAINDYRDLRDADGNPLSRESIIGAAAVAGVLNGLIESTTGLETVAKGVGAGALARMARSEVKRALVSRTQGAALRGMLANIGRTVVEEGGTEYVQSLITSAMGGAAAMLQDKEAPTLGAVRDAVVQALQEGAAGAQGAVALGGVTHVATANAELRAAQRAGRQADAFGAAVEAVKASKLAARMPAKLQEAAEAITTNGPAETLYFPVGAWDTLFQSAAVADPGQAVEEITGSRDAYDEARRTGGDIAIPAAAYLRAVATTALADLHPTLQEEVRIGSPDAMNLRERRDLFARLDAETTVTEQAAAPQETARERLAAATAEALVQSGRYRRADAETNAQIHASVIANLAERTGMAPEALARRFPVTIEGPAGGTPIDVRTMPLDELTERAAALRERQAERAALQAEPDASAAPSDPYAVKEDARDYEAQAERGVYVYARTPKGALRSNLGKVSAEGLVDEMAALMRANEEDSRGSLPSLINDDDMHTSSLGKPYFGVKGAAAKALGRIAARQKSIAKLEAELHRRFGDAYKEALFARLAGTTAETATVDEGDTSFDFAQRVFANDAERRAAFEAHISELRAKKAARIEALRTAIGDGSRPVMVEDERGELGRRIVHRSAIRPGVTQVTAFDGDTPIGHMEYDTLDAAINELAGERFVPTTDALFQDVGDAVRGSIRFQRDASGRPTAARIALAAKADLSTFQHEAAHLYLEMLLDLATDADAPDALTADVATIRAHLGLEEGARPTTEQHETFARSWEAYLMEGKAPSSALRKAFHSFKAWLLKVYRDIRNLNVEISDDVRRVFDRLVATEDEIAAARAEVAADPLFPDPKAVGLTDAQAAAYAEAVADARRIAEDELSAEIIRDVTREQTDQYKAFRERLRGEVAAAVNQEPASLAWAVLKGSRLPDGTALDEDSPLAGLKLDKAGVLEVAGVEGNDAKALLKDLSFLYRLEGGIHPDEAADLFGFASGAELVTALRSAEPTKQRIERLTDERARAEYEGGELLGSEELPAEAMKAVHTERRAALLHRELEILAAQSPKAVTGMAAALVRKVPALAALREEAQRIVAGKRVREIRPIVYQRAEARASREAAQAVKAGDWSAAFEAKQRQILNHELWRAATAAQEEVGKIVDYARTFSTGATRKRIGQAQGDHLAQIDALLERYSFRRRSLAEVDRTRTLAEWADEQRRNGVEPAIDAAILNEGRRVAYQDAPLEELRGVRDAVKQIAHLARSEREALEDAERADLEQREEEIVAGIAAHYSLTREPVDLTKPFRDRLVAGFRRGVAELTRMEFLFRLLDGGAAHRNGPVWRHLFKPFADAEAKENTMQRANAERIAAIFGVYTPAERRQWYRRLDVPEAASAIRQGALTKAQILAIALNQGNAYNRAAVLEGHGWTEGQVEQILAKHMDKRDWDFVQALWDHIDSYWPEARDLERRITGLAPDKVEAAPVYTAHGTYRGGYYPIAFDAELSTRQAALNEDSTLAEMFGGISARAMTKHGHLIQRTNTGGKPIRLDLSVIPEHLNQVIHDVSFRPAVIDVAKLVRRERVREAIEAAAGTEAYRQLGPWLKGIAGDRPLVNDGQVEKWASRARMGGTVVGLGLKLSSSIVQTLGYALTVKELGATYAAKGIARAVGNPLALKARWEFIVERSPMMRDRMASYDRDVRDYARKPDAVALPHSDAWFYFIGATDLATSTATWLGAYAKAMDGKVGDVALGDEHAAVDYADSVVRVTQAAGAAKDLAGVQRGTELRKLFTMFYSSLSIAFNQFYETGGQYRLDRNVPRLVAALAMVWLVPAVMEDMLKGRAPDDDEDASWWAWAAGKAAAYPFATVPVVRDLASSIYRATTTGRVDFSGTPAMAAGEAFVRASLALKQAVSPDEDVSTANARGAADALGYAFRIPSRQLWQTLEYFHDWWTGETQPSNPAVGLWQAFVTGKPKN